MKSFLDTREIEQGMMRDGCIDGYLFLTIVKPRDATGGEAGGR